MTDTSLFFKWIMEMPEKERKGAIDNMKFVSYAYDKYGSMVVSMETENGFNYQLLELANVYTLGNATRKDYENIQPVLRYFGKRIELALNLLSGKTNEEIKKMLEDK